MRLAVLVLSIVIIFYYYSSIIWCVLPSVIFIKSSLNFLRRFSISLSNFLKFKTPLFCISNAIWCKHSAVTNVTISSRKSGFPLWASLVAAKAEYLKPEYYNWKYKFIITCIRCFHLKDHNLKVCDYFGCQIYLFGDLSFVFLKKTVSASDNNAVCLNDKWPCSVDCTFLICSA